MKLSFYKQTNARVLEICYRLTKVTLRGIEINHQLTTQFQNENKLRAELKMQQEQEEAKREERLKTKEAEAKLAKLELEAQKKEFLARLQNKN